MFDSDPLTRRLDLAGPVRLRVRVSSDARTADVLVKLLDVAPDGSAHMIARGQGEVLHPDADRTVLIEMGHAGYRVRPGHRLRVQIASSEFPEFPPNLGNGSNRWLAETYRSAAHVLHASPTQPCALVLTVAPASGAEEAE